LDLHAGEHVRLVAPEEGLIHKAQLLFKLHNFLTLILLTVQVPLDVCCMTKGSFHLRVTLEHILDAAQACWSYILVILVELDCANDTVGLILTKLAPEEVLS
jgi:hypothetical protein